MAPLISWLSDHARHPSSPKRGEGGWTERDTSTKREEKKESFMTQLTVHTFLEFGR